MHNIFTGIDIGAGLREYGETRGALLLDVRTAEEYAAGHVPGSVNLPVDKLEKTEEIADEDTPLFVYCRSGVRSAHAVRMLRSMGYGDVHDIGGILDYTGDIER